MDQQSGDEPYNPLNKVSLGISVAKELLSRPIVPLTSLPQFKGAGVYAIYYLGKHMPFDLYAPIAINTTGDTEAQPIYVGKAIPEGGRKGIISVANTATSVLFNRLKEHRESINQAQNLSINDFLCRYLTVDDIWIPLAETVLIRTFHPIWNVAVDGFGNHDPGKGRLNSGKSPWDILHPGRPWVIKLQGPSSTTSEVRALVKKALPPPN